MTGGGGGDGVRHEVSAGEADELGDAAGEAGADVEDGQAGCAFSEIHDERGAGGRGTEGEADEQDGEIAECDGHGRERQMGWRRGRRARQKGWRRTR